MAGIYFTISEFHDYELFFISYGFSNNNEPAFTDQEAMTVFLSEINQGQCFTIAQTYNITEVAYFSKIT